MTKNVAVLGAGRIGRIHAANVAALPGVALGFVCDPVADSAASLAAALGAHVSAPEAVFADKAIDAVVIGSPTDTHSDLIHRAAAAAGVAYMTGFQRRVDPTFNEANQRLVRGDIGAPEMLVVIRRDPGAPPPEYLKASGGILRDMLIHD